MKTELLPLDIGSSVEPFIGPWELENPKWEVAAAMLDNWYTAGSAVVDQLSGVDRDRGMTRWRSVVLADFPRYYDLAQYFLWPTREFQDLSPSDILHSFLTERESAFSQFGGSDVDQAVVVVDALQQSLMQREPLATALPRALGEGQIGACRLRGFMDRLVAAWDIYSPGHPITRLHYFDDDAQKAELVVYRVATPSKLAYGDRLSDEMTILRTQSEPFFGLEYVRVISWWLAVQASHLRHVFDVPFDRVVLVDPEDMIMDKSGRELELLEHMDYDKISVMAASFAGVVLSPLTMSLFIRTGKLPKVGALRLEKEEFFKS